MTHVSIILVDYDGRKDTRECLRSLQKIKHAGFKFSVVVVDNGSQQPLQISPSDMPPHTQIVRSDTNLGFTEGNNLGYTYAKTHFQPDYILLLNNDTLVDPHFLEELVKHAQAQEKPGLVAPKIYFAPGREFHQESYLPEQISHVLWYAGGSIDWANLDAFHRGVDEVDRGQFDTQTESDFATGCAVLIPVEVINKIGLFPPAYFLYLEDVDLSMRAKFAGFPIYFCPKAFLWHINAGSSGGAGSPLHQYYQTRNRLYFFLKYGSWRSKITVLGLAIRLLLHGQSAERKGVLDWMTGQMGKKPLI